MRALASLLAITLTLSPTVPLFAQSADEKELAAYVLTMPTLNKVMAATRMMAQEMRQDPKVQQLMKLNAQIDQLEKQLEPLQAKDQTTPAEDKQIESLSEQIEKLSEQKEQAEEAMSDAAPSMGNAETLDDMERGMAKFPPMVRALKSQGLTPREYAKFMMAMLQAGMIYGFSQGKVDYAKLPAGVNPENIKFIIAHKAELDAMQKEFAAFGKQQ